MGLMSVADDYDFHDVGSASLPSEACRAGFAPGHGTNRSAIIVLSFCTQGTLRLGRQMLMNTEPMAAATVEYYSFALKKRTVALLCGELGANGMSEDGSIS